MNEQVEKLLANTSDETFTTVARGVLDDESAKITSTPIFEEITTSHADQRTIGIVKVSGSATSNGTGRDWSCVVKIIDPNFDGTHQTSADIKNEVQIYELGLFTGDEVPLRAAKCYLTENHQDGLSSLWLEDLSNGPQPPWSVGLFKTAANHIGQFNGFHVAQNTKLPIDILSNNFLWRHQRNDLKANAAELIQKRDTDIVRAAYAESSVESAVQFFELVAQLLEIGPSLPRGLAFGDTHARNLFPVGNQTIGIDWGTIGMEPLGCDFGVLIGSGLSYGVSEAALVIQKRASHLRLLCRRTLFKKLER